MRTITDAAQEDAWDEGYVWPRPPADGWRADDLDGLAGLPPRTELIDGSLVRTGPQTLFHTRTIHYLMRLLMEQAPEEWEAVSRMTVTLDERNRLEPDVSVVAVAAFTGPRQTGFAPADVLLAVEVVSDDSAARDRGIKPLKYARAGIPHFWRVESDGELPVVHAFALDPGTYAYGPAVSHRRRLTVDRPFPLDIDLTAVHPRRRPAS
ncbi:Uma2 family endonuclease [Streptomyces yaizuensis]|uniref:Uma2 family endonuclease n=1 Tax=Streptomyces yaizuensis TaxID=2989713 RepID=A0ABQ5NW95_9ACTN|nr:Uma2 family endonuclease [Streptomyces sp. YSPA8]GLF94637.1 Uma2 family endonuclease [Streptomyces sp. YSPA8]